MNSQRVIETFLFGRQLPSTLSLQLGGIVSGELTCPHHLQVRGTAWSLLLERALSSSFPGGPSA